MINQLMINLGLNAQGLKAGIGSVKSMLGGLAAAGFGAAAIKDIIDWEHQLNLLGVTAGYSREKIKTVGNEIRDVAMQSGIMANDLVAASAGIVDATGDLESSVSMLGRLAQVSVATDASMQDIGTTYSALRMNTKMTNEAISEFFDTIVGQGDVGSMPFKKTAAEMKALTTVARNLKIEGGKELAQFFGFVQAAAPSLPSASELTSSIQSFQSNILVKSKEIKKLLNFDVNVRGTKELKDFNDLLVGVVAGAGGDYAKLTKIFTEEGARALAPFATLYRETFSTSTGTQVERQQKSVKAILDSLSKFDADFTGNILKKEQFMLAEDKSTKIGKIWESTKVIAQSLFEKPLDELSQMIDQSGQLFNILNNTASVIGGVSAKIMEATGHGIQLAVTTPKEWFNPETWQGAAYMAKQLSPTEWAPQMIEDFRPSQFSQKNYDDNIRKREQKRQQDLYDLKKAEYQPVINITNVGVTTKVTQNNASIKINTKGTK